MPGVGTTHHVKIGADYYLIKPMTYRKRTAPLFGPRFTTGDPDYNTLSFWQHWVQRCWIGGFGAPEWQDEAMFDKSVGVDTSYHEVLLLARDLGPANATRTSNNYNLSQESNVLHKREFFTWRGTGTTEQLYCLSMDSATGGVNDARLFRYAAPNWVQVNSFARDCRSFARFRKAVVFGTSTGNLRKMTGSPGAEVFADIAKPSGITATPRAMYAWRKQLWVGFDDELWRLNLDDTWDGSTAFYTAAEVTHYTGFEPHLGFLYMSSNNGHILRTDGNATFDLWSMEPGTEITGMRSFDGRLFVACRDPLEGTDASEAVLYQFTGAAVTELKRLGKIGVENTFGKLRALGGRLLMGASSLFGFDGGFGITMYNPVEDSYHIFASNRDGSTYAAGTEQAKWCVDDVIWFREYLWCSVRGHGIFRTRYTVRDVSELLATYDNTPTSGVQTNGGWIETSEFDGGTPGMKKLWNAIVMDVDLPTSNTEVGVDYSVDGGVNWVAAGTATKTGSPRRYVKELLLGSGTSVYSSTLKVRLRLKTTDGTRSPAVRGLSVRYLPVPDPNWVWEMTLVLSDNQVLLDGTTEAPDNVTKRANLEAAHRAQTIVNFVDIDGVSWATGSTPGVLIQTMQEVPQHIGPSSEGALEHEIQITLIEAVEAYS